MDTNIRSNGSSRFVLDKFAPIQYLDSPNRVTGGGKLADQEFAPLVTDGILLPWQVDETRGTIFVMAHGRIEAFDGEDARMMQLLADFAAMGFRQQHQQKELMEKERAAAAAAMANELAHKINNPLQALTNQLYIAGAS